MANIAPNENHLFLVPALVRPGPGQVVVDAECLHALISCYVAAPNHLDAFRLSVEKLKADGYFFEDVMNGQVHEIDAARWDEHIATVWAEYTGQFPSQAEVLKFLKSGGVFFGPVCGLE